VVTLDDDDVMAALEAESELAVSQLMDEECPIDDEICTDPTRFDMARSKLKGVIGRTLSMVRSGDLEDGDLDGAFGESVLDGEEMPLGEVLERGWETRGNSSALRRNSEVWKFALKSVFKILGARKLRKKGGPTRRYRRPW